MGAGGNRARRGSAVLAWAVALVAMSVSGCLAGGEAASSPEPEPADDRSDGRIVDGTVVDQELRPIASVTIVEVGGSANTTTDEAGGFRMDGLPPAPEVLIQARHPDYDPQTLRLDLQFVPRAEVRFVLSGGPRPNGYYETNITKGLIACQVAFGSHHGFPGFYRQSCGEVVPPSKEHVRVPVDPAIRAAVLELKWEPQSQGADIMGMTVYVSTSRDELLVGTMHSYPGDHYIHMFIGSIAMQTAKDIGGVLDTFVHVDPSAVDEHVPTNAGVVIQQSFMLYTTAFYWDAPYPTWSALPAK